MIKSCNHGIFQLFNHHKKITEPKEAAYEKLKQLITTLELVRIEDMVRVPEYWQGQSPKNRKQIARSFIAKAVYNMDTTRQLIDKLKISPALHHVFCMSKDNCELYRKTLLPSPMCQDSCPLAKKMF